MVATLDEVTRSHGGRRDTQKLLILLMANLLVLGSTILFYLSPTNSAMVIPALSTLTFSMAPFFSLQNVNVKT